MDQYKLSKQKKINVLHYVLGIIGKNIRGPTMAEKVSL